MNYPKGIKRNNENNYIRFDNRGMGLEEDINLTNQYYIDKMKIKGAKKYIVCDYRPV